jgi:hypothetical protein
MLYYTIEHPVLILSYFLIPLFGWGMSKLLPGKIIGVIASIAILLFLPVLIGYSYVDDSINGISLFFVLSCAHSFLFKRTQKVMSALLSLTAIFFCVFGFLSFMGSFAGTITIEKEWKLNGYKIRYLRDQGFSGGPLMKYELNEYAPIPILIRQVDSKADDDTTGNCIVKFEYKNFSFNKCSD